MQLGHWTANTDEECVFFGHPAVQRPAFRHSCRDKNKKTTASQILRRSGNCDARCNPSLHYAISIRYTVVLPCSRVFQCDSGRSSACQSGIDPLPMSSFHHRGWIAFQTPHPQIYRPVFEASLPRCAPLSLRRDERAGQFRCCSSGCLDRFRAQ